MHAIRRRALWLICLAATLFLCGTNTFASDVDNDGSVSKVVKSAGLDVVVTGMSLVPMAAPFVAVYKGADLVEKVESTALKKEEEILRTEFIEIKTVDSELRKLRAQGADFSYDPDAIQARRNAMELYRRFSAQPQDLSKYRVWLVEKHFTYTIVKVGLEEGLKKFFEVLLDKIPLDKLTKWLGFYPSRVLVGNGQLPRLFRSSRSLIAEAGGRWDVLSRRSDLAWHLADVYLSKSGKGSLAEWLSAKLGHNVDFAWVKMSGELYDTVMIDNPPQPVKQARVRLTMARVGGSYGGGGSTDAFRSTVGADVVNSGSSDHSWNMQPVYNGVYRVMSGSLP